MTINEDVFLTNTLGIANVELLVKESIRKIGVEYMAPIDAAIQHEKISKAINKAANELDGA